ncbi:TetR/AcrR family transcriptional regulator [Amycolatopsis sp. K13G38]|uniref:TetR/AcrR family transcriptional regulator n=1 Tax=Amycolatopsis acididurans TaxID=2724524 RepID=A0ABX1IVS6_9PSEU|nr:TetR/AcrR family transcriptional regulator [Amycolatopsis acididurans]NKQ51568.1 TetR/AcrR family transcriptional regulator [Amycolatopsis acididurans]
MASQRRIGAPDAKNRGILLDAAEQLMLEEGYAAVTSRRVAAKAGLKSQLVHYYFRTMDDLFLAMFERRAEEGLAHQKELLESDRPLRALWAFNTESAATAFSLEFGAVANHRKAIRAQVARYSELFRAAQLDAAAGALKSYRVPPEVCTPEALVMMMTAIARIMAMEDNLGFTMAHNETVEFMERYLDQLENYGKRRTRTKKLTG